MSGIAGQAVLEAGEALQLEKCEWERGFLTWNMSGMAGQTVLEAGEALQLENRGWDKALSTVLGGTTWALLTDGACIFGTIFWRG